MGLFLQVHGAHEEKLMVETIRQTFAKGDRTTVRTQVRAALKTKLSRDLRISLFLIAARTELADDRLEAAESCLSAAELEINAAAAGEVSAATLEQTNLARGVILSGRGKFTEAAILLQKITLNAINQEVKIEAATELGQCLFACGQVSEALISWRHALAIAKQHISDHEDVRYTRIAKLIAQAEQRHASSLLGDDEKLYQQALADMGQNKFEIAEGHFRDLLKRYPGSGQRDPSCYFLGQCCRSRGKVDEAWEIWQAFIDKDPGGSWRGQARQGIFDIALEVRLDAKLAGAILDQDPSLALNWKASDGSWTEAVPALRLRKVILLFVLNQQDAAEKLLAHIEPLFRTCPVSPVCSRASGAA